MSENTFVELYAGLAAVTLRLFDEVPPVSRIGAKTGYAEAIIQAMQIPHPDHVILVDSDHAVCNVLEVLFDNGARGLVANYIEERLAVPARELWITARARKLSMTVEGAACWLLFTAGARGGIGGFKGAHKLRPNVDGFIPARASLVRRLRDWRPRGQFEVRCGIAEDQPVIPGAWVYLDPPYENRQGYGALSTVSPLAVALRWRQNGAHRVGISEARKLATTVVAQHVDLTHARRGQTRFSLTQDSREWLTIL